MVGVCSTVLFAIGCNMGNKPIIIKYAESLEDAVFTKGVFRALDFAFRYYKLLNLSEDSREYAEITRALQS